MVKLRTRLKARKDNLQMMLAPTEKKGHKRRGKPIPARFEGVTGKFLCPFCLHIDVITRYLISTRKGWHKSNGKCPECEEGMHLESLTKRMTPAEFGQWVYDYPAWRFWKKCHFDKFNKRLKTMGWAYQFWNTYKGTKAEDKTPSYEEYMMAEQQKWAKEQGYI